jgi:predicted ATPase/class 3 adenylate cyclase
MILPTGTVTFLFTDIEGSTKMAREHPDSILALLARHNEILKQSIQAHHGYIFQVVGDSFAAAFHNASDALNAALEAQRLLHNESWLPAPVKVRMGIHTGSAQLNDASAPIVYSGYATIASTQRIMSAGHGGQILLSGATRELVRDMLPENTELLDMGEKRLKDLLRPEHLYQLNISGLASTFPPLKTLDSFPNNLPTQLTTFIGRENEIAEVKQELESHRLVTLTGSGGTGKTRLSLQVAADLLEKYDHGIWFVELAPLTDPDLIPQTILSTIGIQDQQGKTPLEVLKEYFHEKQSLVLLDNCEHLVSASAQVVNTLLNAAPKLKVLASSREALGVKGEASYPVPSLSLPDIKHLPVIEQLSQYEAVRLFIDRALLVAPHFVVDKDNAPFIAQTCHRLDGIPLAIELAAARVKMLSVDQISKRLDDRFHLLTGGARTALPRQQTLRALIDWSYDLLSENERLLLRRLSVFIGGWTLEAAEEVCSDQSAVTSQQSGTTADWLLVTDILDLLTQLVNKSLVMVIAEGSQSGETRYRMLETIRQYAREKLLEAGGGEIIRDRHLTYFVKLAERAETELYRANQAFWLNKLDDELDNLRTALEWALTRDVQSGLRITVLARQFWLSRGHTQELADWLWQLLERHETKNSLHAQAMAVYCLCTIDFEHARTLAEQSLQLARALADKEVEAYSLMSLGAVIALQGDLKEGIPLVEQSRDLYQTLGNKLGQASAMSWLVLNHNDLAQTKAIMLDALRLFRELGHLSGMANCLSLLAHRVIWTGDFSSPVPWLDEAMAIYQQLGDETGQADTLNIQGSLAYWLGNYQQARTYYEEAILLYDKVGSHWMISWSHVNLAYAVLRQGDFIKARELFRVCIQRFQKTNTIIGLIYAVEGFASLNVNQSRAEHAAPLYAWADATRDKIGDYRPPLEQASVERDLAVIRAQLTDKEFANVLAVGSKMTMEQAIALTLEN